MAFDVGQLGAAAPVSYAPSTPVSNQIDPAIFAAMAASHRQQALDPAVAVQMRHNAAAAAAAAPLDYGPLDPAIRTAFRANAQQASDPRDALLAFLLQHVHAQAQQGQHPLDSLAAVLSGAHAAAPHPGRLPAAPRFGHLPHPFVAPTY